jgi:tryptophanyl-tRNA synthetase
MNDKKPVILTGDRPTGRLHLGHYIGSLANRIAMQDSTDMYIMIADVQALTDNFDNPQKVRDNILEVAMDYLAVGLDPAKCTIFVQSRIPALAELTMYYLNLVTVSRLQRNPTVKAEIQQKGFETSLPAGFLCYPVSQAADITAFGANLVPVGEDQLPMIEQTREIVDSFNRIYGETLVKPEGKISKIGRLPGLDGKAKMSKSLNNAIYLSDTPEELASKVKQMVSDPGHIKIEGSGIPEHSIVFQYLDAFDPDKSGLEELKSQYRKGGVPDSHVKERLLTVLTNLLDPIRERRKAFEANPERVQEMLEQGTAKANVTAHRTLSKVRNAMKLF